MSALEHTPKGRKSDRLTTAASALGYEIVYIAGFLDMHEEHAQALTSGLNVLKARAADMSKANDDVGDAVAETDVF